MKSFRTAILAAAAGSIAFISSVPASAHGIWFAERARNLALIYGEGADDLDAVRRLPLITTFSGYDAEWAPLAASLTAKGPLAVVDSESSPAAVAAVMDYGIWSRTADGKWQKKGRDELPEAVVATHNWKYAVHLRQPLKSTVPLIPGHTLQLVPVDAAIPQVKDQPIRLRAYYEGKPVAGVEIFRDAVNDPDAPTVKTNADGIATIKVRNQGLNVVMAVYNHASSDKSRIDKTEHTATLSFVLPHKGE